MLRSFSFLSHLSPLCFFSASRWLCNPQIDAKTRKWAIEGLAYLTNDADVKDDFVEDELALKAMFELSKVGKQQTIGQEISPQHICWTSETTFCVSLSVLVKG